MELSSFFSPISDALMLVLASAAGSEAGVPGVPAGVAEVLATGVEVDEDEEAPGALAAKT